MAWPKGKKRKPNDTTTETVSSSTVATMVVAGQEASRYDLVLGIRRIRGGNFAGLWELSELTEEEGILKSVRIMTDANIKPILLAQIGKRLNRCF